MKITFTLLCRIEFRSLLFFIPKWKLWNHYFLKPIVLSPDSLHFLQGERKENATYCYELYPSTNLLFSVLLSFLSAVSHAMFLFCTLHWVVPYSQKNPTSNCPFIWFGAILICLSLYSCKKIENGTFSWLSCKVAKCWPLDERNEWTASCQHRFFTFLPPIDRISMPLRN